MMDEWIKIDAIEEEPTADGGESYRPEGNEAGVLREYCFRLDERSLTEGLVFPEMESTLVPGQDSRF